MISVSVGTLYFRDIPESGVYLLYAEDGHLMYVGRSNSVFKRLASHRDDGVGPKRKRFHKAEFYSVPVEHLKFVEAGLIKRLKPTINTQIESVEPYGEGLEYVEYIEALVLGSRAR